MKNKDLLITILLFTFSISYVVLFTDLHREFIDEIIPLGSPMYKYDGSDDTTLLQNMINSDSNVYIPEGVYWVNATIGLHPKSNQTITLSEDAYINVIPNSTVYYRIFHLENVENVILSGGTLIGDRYAHYGYEGEWGFGILVSSNTNNITIKDMSAIDFWGDGFYIGGDTTDIPTDILIENVISNNNRRQGLSITQALNVTVKDSEFTNTHGTAPEAGIDLEPNQGDIVKNISIINVICKDNAGDGIDLFGELGLIEGVEIINSTLENNYTGLMLRYSSLINIESTEITHNDYVGVNIIGDTLNATFYQVTISENAEHGVSIITNDQKVGVKDIIFDECTVINNAKSDKYSYDGIRIDNYDGTKSIDNVSFSKCIIGDEQRYGITVGFNGGIGDVIVSDCEFSNNLIDNYLGI